jgi:hypothetical protein
MNQEFPTGVVPTARCVETTWARLWSPAQRMQRRGEGLSGHRRVCHVTDEEDLLMPSAYRHLRASPPPCCGRHDDVRCQLVLRQLICDPLNRLRAVMAQVGCQMTARGVCYVS